jgi:uncharacterized repeat protein (TIGR03803 family)
VSHEKSPFSDVRLLDFTAEENRQGETPCRARHGERWPLNRKGIAALCLGLSFLVMAPSLPANGGTVSVTLSPASVSVPVGGAQTFTATVAGTSNTAVTWSIAEGIQGGTISHGITWNEGIYSPPSSTGTFHVVAISRADPAVRATAVVQVIPALTFKVLHAFSGPDGLQPVAKLIQGSDNDLYGTTVAGGAYRLGAIFEVDSSGNLTILHSFNGRDGMSPRSGLVQGRDGNFYGVAQASGGYGTIFRVDSSGNFKNLHFFSPSEGANPYSALIQAADGYFYGTAGGGGAEGCGTVYRADPNGNVQVLHSFYFSRRASQINPKDGCAPRAGLVQASDGNFYGTTTRGGPKGLGTVFKMDSGGRVTILHFFSFSDGSEPEAPVIQGKDGSLYSTATGGPRSNGGEVFKIGLSGNFSVVHAFAGPDGLQPDTGLFEGKDGYFYGITSAGGGFAGVMYRMDPQGNVTVLHYFQYFPSSRGGIYPRGGILQGSDGRLYGVAQAGGGNQSGGVLYVAGTPGLGNQSQANRVQLAAISVSAPSVWSTLFNQLECAGAALLGLPLCNAASSAAQAAQGFEAVEAQLRNQVGPAVISCVGQEANGISRAGTATRQGTVSVSQAEKCVIGMTNIYIPPGISEQALRDLIEEEIRRDGYTEVP